MTSTSSPIAMPPAGTYRLDPVVSRLKFTTRHLFGMAKVTGSFTFGAGTITIAEPVTGSTAQATVTVAGFRTNSGKRDRQVKSAGWLNAAQYPTMSFASQQAALSAGVWTLRGMLSVRGMPAPIELAVTGVHVDGSTLTLHAKSRVDRYAFGVTKHKGMAGRFLDLDVQVVAVRSS